MPVTAFHSGSMPGRMTTTVTVRWDGAPSCRDCQQVGVPVCDHIGFTDEPWSLTLGHTVHVPGLDRSPDYTHILRAATISPDRKTVHLVVDTERPQHHDLGRHLSVLHTPKAAVQAVHHDTGAELAAGRYDAHLQPGQTVYVNGAPHLVQRVEHPNRDEHGVAGDRDDIQVATLVPQPGDTITADATETAAW